MTGQASTFVFSQDDLAEIVSDVARKKAGIPASVAGHFHIAWVLRHDNITAVVTASDDENAARKAAESAQRHLKP